MIGQMDPTTASAAGPADGNTAAEEKCKVSEALLEGLLEKAILPG